MPDLDLRVTCRPQFLQHAIAAVGLLHGPLAALLQAVSTDSLVWEGHVADKDGTLLSASVRVTVDAASIVPFSLTFAASEAAQDHMGDIAAPFLSPPGK